jgi:hypothetical protein
MDLRTVPHPPFGERSARARCRHNVSAVNQALSVVRSCTGCGRRSGGALCDQLSWNSANVQRRDEDSSQGRPAAPISVNESYVNDDHAHLRSPVVAELVCASVPIVDDVPRAHDLRLTVNSDLGLAGDDDVQLLVLAMRVSSH